MRDTGRSETCRPVSLFVLCRCFPRMAGEAKCRSHKPPPCGTGEGDREAVVGAPAARYVTFCKELRRGTACTFRLFLVESIRFLRL